MNWTGASIFLGLVMLAWETGVVGWVLLGLLIATLSGWIFKAKE